MREAERNARGEGEARFRPAIDVMNRFVHRRGYDTLQQMVLSARA